MTTADNGHVTQTKVLEYIKKHIEETGESPGYKQIAEACFIERAYVWRVLVRLEEDGQILKRGRKGIVVVKQDGD